jgi:D-serine deaminase-like pyridoxal phosphate-dependent protein
LLGHMRGGYSRSVDPRLHQRRYAPTRLAAHSENPAHQTEKSSSSDDLARFERATSELEPPFAVIDLDAFWSNALDLRRRASGKPIRLATKSVRCRALQERVLASDGFRGTLCFTLPEALWLADNGGDDLLVAYPTSDRIALKDLARRMIERPDLHLAVMVDSVEHLDLIDAAAGPRDVPIRVCIDVDAGWWLLKGRVRIGAKRSPVHTPEEAVALASEVRRRRGFRLVGIMAYEAQIAGLGDAPSGQPLKAMAIRAMQKRSARELAARRAAVLEAIQEISTLEFVNGGGTGSIERTASEAAITEVAAGSGLFAPALFSSYRGFQPRPAAFFALPVVRRPGPATATVLGGGYLASGPADESRLPEPWLPKGLKLDRLEGAGEVQTPLLGEGAARLRVGDRVYFRHAKAGEMCERFDELYLIEGDRVVDKLPTYRGEGRCFL